MLVVNQLERSFSFKDKNELVRLPDPSGTFSPEAVLNFYAQTYPILTTAKIVGPEIKNDLIEYRFETIIGTKG